jgi:hypothetical protein
LSALLLNDIKPWFLTEGKKLAAILIIPSSWGSQLADYYFINSVASITCAYSAHEEVSRWHQLAKKGWFLFNALCVGYEPTCIFCHLYVAKRVSPLASDMFCFFWFWEGSGI